MSSSTTSLATLASALLLAGAAVTQLSGCSASPAPTAPTTLASPIPDGGLASAVSSSSLSFDADVDLDPAVHGSEAQLTGFDGVSLLSFTTTKGSFTATFDTSTVLRSAQIPKYQPTDPCRQFAIDYNAGGTTGDVGGVTAAVTSLASGGCLARIHLDRTIPQPPPIKSFRPLATF